MKFNIPYRISLIVFIISFSLSCRTSKPPGMTVCLGNGAGGADCVDQFGVRSTKLPSELEDFFMLSPSDASAYSSWCFHTTTKLTDPIVKDLLTVMRENQRNEPKAH